MSNLMTAEEIKPIVSPVVALDPSFFSTSIDYTEEFLISCILTTALYDDMVAKIAALPAPPLSAADQLLYDKIQKAEAYAVAFAGYSKDLERKTNNQGIMENHTQWSKSAAATSAKRILAVLKQREFDYCLELGNFLIADAALAVPLYPLFDADSIVYEPNFRRFFPL
jgi:hypothetical protein